VSFGKTVMKILKDLKTLVEGLGITGKHLGRHAITIQYPEERWTIPERSRGIVVLLSDKETGELNCTGCMLCGKACPTGAIYIEAPRDEKKRRQLKQFIVDHGICCFCGLCEEACNFSALKMATKYEFSAERKEDLVWDMKKLQEVGRDVPYEDTRKKKKAEAKPATDKAKTAVSTAKSQPVAQQKEETTAESEESVTRQKANVPSEQQKDQVKATEPEQLPEPVSRPETAHNPPNKPQGDGDGSKEKQNEKEGQS
jgi:NADH-quinone oxidoreductase subunit I